MHLTRYKEGSIGELMTLSLPLMLSSLSVMAMLFVDRIFLAQYSQAAFSAAISASTTAWAFIIFWFIAGSISEVFVARFNGSGKRERLGAPVWQMIWLSFLSFFFFILLARYGADLIWDNDHPLEKQYFTLLILFGPSYPFYAALAGYFVGQGRTLLITALSVIANLINALLDWIFIFGIEGVVPSLGISGAALATGGSQLFQALILLFFFLRKREREEFQTGSFGIDARLFLDCIKIGLPGAFFGLFEMFGWAVFYQMMDGLSMKHLTIAGIWQSIIILCYFFPDGINKAVTAITGNLIGAKRLEIVHDVKRSALTLTFIFTALASITFFIFADEITALFLDVNQKEITSGYLSSVKVSIFFVIIYIFFETLRMSYAGMLTAAGDTLFLCIASGVSIWVFLLVPIWFIVVLPKNSIEVATFIGSVYSVTAFLLYRWRYQSGKWKEIKIASMN